MESEQLDTIYPGMWRFPTHLGRCCIYRVPTYLREINDEAYTPRLVLIGPLHYALKVQSRRSLGNISDYKSFNYLNTEEIKKRYLAEFSQRLQTLGKSIASLREIIEQKERAIRDCYSESTIWIKSREFVDMILRDCVFILLFSWKTETVSRKRMRSGDPLLDVPCLENGIKRDLMLLENQLPFYILDKLFASIVPTLFPGFTLHDLVMRLYFSNETGVVHGAVFLHFTDLMRGVHAFSLPKRDSTNQQAIENMPSAYQLYSRGVKFEVLEKNFSLNVTFENGCLRIPRLCVDDTYEVTLRNLVAFEQCQYPHDAHISSYLTFISFLINTYKDIDLLVKKGVITSWIGKPSLVAEMVNKLHRDISLTSTFSFYSSIANRVNVYYKNPINKKPKKKQKKPINKSCFFSETIMLLLTLIQTVCSITQVKQK